MPRLSSATGGGFAACAATTGAEAAAEAAVRLRKGESSLEGEVPLFAHERSGAVTARGHAAAARAGGTINVGVQPLEGPPAPPPCGGAPAHTVHRPPCEARPRPGRQLERRETSPDRCAWQDSSCTGEGRAQEAGIAAV